MDDPGQYAADGQLFSSSAAAGRIESMPKCLTEFESAVSYGEATVNGVLFTTVVPPMNIDFSSWISNLNVYSPAKMSLGAVHLNSHSVSASGTRIRVYM